MKPTLAPEGRVLVVGSANIDLVVRAARIPHPGETVPGGDLAVVCGGKGANQAVAAARLGARCDFVGRVGDDAFGQRLLAGLREAGVGLDHVAVTPGCPSGAALIVVAESGENAICVSPGANARLSPSDLDAAEAAFQQARVCLLQLEVPPGTVQHAAALCRRHCVAVVLDPAPPPADLPDDLYRVAVITPNAHEAVILTGRQVLDDPSQARKAAEILHRRGATSVVIKMGPRGALLWDPEVCEHLPAHQVPVVDTTGAGDAFNGALGAALAAGRRLREAVRLANAAGAVACTRPGAQPSMPTPDEMTPLLGNG